jgi:O-antigen/teichoic acid export membrane protein
MIMTVATALAIIGTGTRSIAVGAIIATIVSFTLARRFKLFLGVGTLASIIVATFSNKIFPLFTHDPAFVSNRFFLWQEAIKLIVSHPWIGIGLWQFPKYYDLLITDPRTRLNGHGGIQVHEQYLDWAVQSGILWAIIGVLLLLSITYACWRAYPLAQRKQQALLLAAMLATLANISIGFFDTPLDGTEQSVFLFLLVGLALGQYRSGSAQGTGSMPRPGSAQGTTPTRPTHSRYPGSSIISVGVVPCADPGPCRRNVASNRKGQYRLNKGTSNLVGTGLAPVREVVSPSSASTANTTAPNVQKTSRSIIIQIASWAIPIPLVFVVTALLTRYLGPTQYGEYSFTFTFFVIFALLSGTGMDQLFIRQLVRQARTEWGDTLSYAAGTRLLSTALSAATAILLALVLPIPAELRNLLLLGSVWLFFSFSVNTLRTVYSYGFAAEQRVGVISLLTTINRLVTSGLVILIVLLRIPLLWAYAIIVYSDLPFFILLVMVARRRFGIRVRFSLAYTRKHLLDSLPLTGYDALALLAGQADMLLLIILSGPLSVGFYALASRLTDPLLSIVFAYVGGLYPLLCAKFGEGRKQFSKVYQESARVLALVTIPLAIFVSLRASAIVALLGGQSFAPAAIALQLLIWSIAAGFLQQLAMRTSTAANLERRVPYLSAVSVSINLLLNLALIPHWQFIGAAVASLSSELISLLLFNLLIRQHVHLLPFIGVLLRVFAGNLPMLLFLIWQEQAPLLLTIPPALVLSIVGCLVTRVLSVKDIHLMRHILDTRRNIGTLKDIHEQPTIILPQGLDIAECPTVILHTVYK